MTYDNSGILFKNDRKEKDTHPDYTGRCTIGGVEYYQSAWIKKGAKGSFMTFSYKVAESKAEEAKQYIEQKPEEFDDDIPF